MSVSTVFEVPSNDFFAFCAITSTSMFSLNSFNAEPVRLADSFESVLIVEGKSSVTNFFDSRAMFCVVPSKFSRSCMSESFFATDFCTLSMLPLTSSMLAVAVPKKSDAADFERSKMFVGGGSSPVAVFFLFFLFSLSLLLLLLLLLLFVLVLLLLFSRLLFLCFPSSRSASFFTVIAITRRFALVNASSVSFFLASIAAFTLLTFSFNFKLTSFVIFSAFALIITLLLLLPSFPLSAFLFLFFCCSSCLRASAEEEEEEVNVAILSFFIFSTTSFHLSSTLFLSFSRGKTNPLNLFAESSSFLFFFGTSSFAGDETYDPLFIFPSFSSAIFVKNCPPFETLPLADETARLMGSIALSRSAFHRSFCAQFASSLDDRFDTKVFSFSSLFLPIVGTKKSKGFITAFSKFTFVSQSAFLAFVLFLSTSFRARSAALLYANTKRFFLVVALDDDFEFRLRLDVVFSLLLRAKGEDEGAS